MRFRDNPPTVSLVISRRRLRGLRVRYKRGHTFNFPYKICNSKDSTNIVRSSEMLLVRNGTSLLSAQLIRQAYGCVISHGHERCSYSSCLLALAIRAFIDSPRFSEYSFHMFTDKSCGLLVQSITATSIASTAEAP
jgi:hypothetical protein